MQNKIIIVFGTRPELIKLIPVILEFKKRGKNKNLIIINTGQHDELIKNELVYFKITPDYTLESLAKGQSLSALTYNLLHGLEDILIKLKKNTIKAIIAQGDTTTVFVTSLISFYYKIPFLHVEAGLRTNDFSNPFPEEFNRRVADMLAQFHYAHSTKQIFNM